MIIRRARRYTVSQREAAFWAKVKKGEHWLWLGHCNKKSGHPQFWNGERVVGAHVFAWELEHGPVPEGMEIRHLCEYPACILHITVGTRAENMQDMVDQHRCWYHQRPEEIIRGERHGRSKLTEAAVVKIRARLAEGISYGQLAREFAVSKPTIASIRHGRTWGGVAR